MFEDHVRLQRFIQFLWIAALIVVVIATLPLGANTHIPDAVDDKTQHFIAYFGLGILGGTGWPQKRLMLLWSMPAFGLAMEFLQGTLMSGRVFDWYDAVANTAGVFAGVAASVLARRVLFKAS